jgi:hypothetical protein
MMMTKVVGMMGVVQQLQWGQPSGESWQLRSLVQQQRLQQDPARQLQLAAMV